MPWFIWLQIRIHTVVLLKKHVIEKLFGEKLDILIFADFDVLSRVFHDVSIFSFVYAAFIYIYPGVFAFDFWIAQPRHF